MKKGRRNFPAKLKAKVAIEAVEGGKTLSELSINHEVHSEMISAWKKTFSERAEELYETQGGRLGQADDELNARLYQQIGELQTELSWLKKRWGRKSGSSNALGISKLRVVYKQAV
jgi:transposase-like protein